MSGISRLAVASVQSGKGGMNELKSKIQNSTSVESEYPVKSKKGKKK